MSFSSFMLARLYGLPQRRYGARSTRDIEVVAPDGVVLATDHFAPKAEGPHPTILMRLPYGRKGFDTVAEVYAERGFNVVLQACRGTGGSGGEFDPLTHEREDGLATLDWIKAQPWFDGRLGTSGPSYLGYAQWAICDALPEVSAMSTKVSSAEFRTVVFPSGAFHLQLWLSWLQTIEGISRSPGKMMRRMMTGGIERKTLEASMTLPLVEADRVAVGAKVPFWRRWFEMALEDGPFWDKLDHRHRIGPKTPPNHFISGWYDFMIDQLLRDYQATVAAGQTPHLTVGPWFHVSNELQAESMRQTLIWMRAHLLDERALLRSKPVRLHIGGLETWREYDQFPPPGPQLRLFHLHPGHALFPQPALPNKSSDRYLYDPAFPTPNLGGNIFAFSGAGPVDNHEREERADVLTYTSDPMTSDMLMIGNASFTLYARAERPFVDFFVRLCDVNRHGVSTNIADGLIRCTHATPERRPDGTMKLVISLTANAYCFRTGHRLRVQVSSGAHPRFARNTGTGEAVGTGTTLIANRIEILRDPDHPSSISLPTYPV